MGLYPRLCSMHKVLQYILITIKVAVNGFMFDRKYVEENHQASANSFRFPQQEKGGFCATNF